MMNAESSQENPRQTVHTCQLSQMSTLWLLTSFNFGAVIRTGATQAKGKYLNLLQPPKISQSVFLSSTLTTLNYIKNHSSTDLSCSVIQDNLEGQDKRATAEKKTLRYQPEVDQGRQFDQEKPGQAKQASDREKQLKQEKVDQARQFDQEKRDQAKQLESADLLLRNKIVLLDSVKLENAQLGNAKERAEQFNKYLREELTGKKATARYYADLNGLMSTELVHLRSRIPVESTKRVDQLTIELDELRAHHEDVILQHSLNLSAQKAETNRLNREVSQMQEQLNTKNKEFERLERTASKLREDLSKCRQQLLRQRGVMLQGLRAADKTADADSPRHSSTDSEVDPLPLSTADEMADSQRKQPQNSAMKVERWD